MPTFGTAGRYARGRFDYVVRVVVVYLAASLVLAVPAALLVSAHLLWFLPGTAIVLVASRWKEFWRLMSPWLKGARGEEKVGRLLDEIDVEGYRILHDTDTGKGNLDHVVIGPTGIFAVETKAWTGSVYPGRGGRLMRSGQDEARAIRQATAEAMEVRSRLGRVGLEVWVEALIVLTATRLPRGPLRFRGVTVMEADGLVEHVRSGSRGLEPDDVARAASAVLWGDRVGDHRVLDQ